MTALSAGKQFVQLNPTTRGKAIAQKQNYVVKDGKPYSLDTGEYLGDLFTHDLVPKMTESKFRAIESVQALGSHEEENGGFVFAFFQQSRTIIERFPSLNNADIARLMYLGTYIAWNTGRLQYDNGKVINREGFEKLTGLSRKRARELFSRYCQEGIISESEGALFMNPTVFFRGNIKSIQSHTADLQHTRMFKKTVRDLYDLSNGRTVGQLALVYSVLPFLNFETNIVCHNPDETDSERLQPMNIESLAELLGYANAAKLKMTMNRVKIDGKVVFGFFENTNDRRQKGITVNPRVVFGGNGEQLQAIRTQFNQFGGV